MTLTDYHKTKQTERNKKLDLLNRTWEIPKEEIAIMNMLDSGEFSQIYMAKIKKSPGREFVVKRAKDKENGLIRSEMTCEYEVLAELSGHVNIVEMCGVSYFPPQSELVLIFQCYRRGNLQQVLLEMREQIETSGAAESQPGEGAKVLKVRKKI